MVFQRSLQFLTFQTMKYNTDIATRVFAVSLKAPYSGKTTAEVATITGLTKSTISKIYARAIARGLDSNQQPLDIRNSYFEDAPPTAAAQPSVQKRLKKQ